MKIRLPLLVTALGCALLLNRAPAQVVNFNFGLNNPVSYSGQGAYSDPGNNYWNAVGPNFVEDFDFDTFDFITSPGTYAQTRSPMYASDGTTLTNIRIVFYNNGITGDANSPDNSFGSGDNQPFADGLFHQYYYTSGTEAFTISGLTAGQAYDFYFYGSTGRLASDRSGIVTLDGDSLPFTSATQSAFVEGDNFVKFNVIPSGTSLSGSIARNITAVGETNLAGLQIVPVASVPVPEPATYAAVLGAIALAGVVIQRRRSKPVAG